MHFDSKEKKYILNYILLSGLNKKLKRASITIVSLT